MKSMSYVRGGFESPIRSRTSRIFPEDEIEQNIVFDSEEKNALAAS